MLCDDINKIVSGSKLEYGFHKNDEWYYIFFRCFNFYLTNKIKIIVLNDSIILFIQYVLIYLIHFHIKSIKYKSSIFKN